MTTRPAMLPLVDIADELGVGAIDPAAGRAQLLALELDTGEFDLPTLAIRAETRGLVTGYIVARGQLAAGVTLAGRTATQLLGPGDLLPVVSEEDELLPRALGFTVIQPAVLAVCDDRFHVVSQRWPAIASRLLLTAGGQLERAAVQQAISQLPRVEIRVLALMWHLAERWGHVTPGGLALTLGLTHATLGELVGARRPTVSLALRWLDEEGLLKRRDDGSWLLSTQSTELLATSGAPVRTVARSRRLQAVPAAADGAPRTDGLDPVRLHERFARLRTEQQQVVDRTTELLERLAEDRRRREQQRRDMGVRPD